MKVKYIYEGGDPKYEGLTKIAKNLKKELKAHGIKFTEDIEDADLIHIHSGGFLLAKKYAKYGDKCIYTLYSAHPESALKLLRTHVEYFTRYYNQLHNPVKAIKNAIFSIGSAKTPLSIKKKYLKKMNTVIIPNKIIQKQFNLPNSIYIQIGTDTTKFKRKNIQHELTVAYVGHNFPAKGLTEVINAFKLIKNPTVKLKLFLSKYSKRTARIAMNKNKNIEVHGFVDDLPTELNKIDILVLPLQFNTASIAVPLVLIEGMATEKAIITTNLDYIKSIAKNTVVYTQPYSARELAYKIEKLIQNPKLRKNLGKNARTRVIENFNWTNTVNEYKQLYKKLSN